MDEKILIVEDEAPIADAVAYALRKEGFQVTTAGDGAQGLGLAREQSPDLLILDIMLPVMNGLDVCRILRSESKVPIIMLTAKGEEVDRVVGLELGADDYVMKPFSMRELVARVQAVLRRSHISRESGKPDIIKIGDIVVDGERRLVTVRNQELHLPYKEFQLLYMLVKNRDRVLTRETLMNSVWSEDSYYNSRTLDVHIRWLREKIEDDPGMPRRIVTVRGVGYMFVGRNHDQTD